MDFCFLKVNKKVEEAINLIDKEKRLNVVGGDISFFAFFISIIFHNLEKNLIVVLPTEKKCEIFYYDILNFVDKKDVKFLPSPDYNP
ncbi:MAG: hypothetical protein NC816_06640, partial [Candidatus Omnitrophica bacterium]|nr:hypothetical protein [Candidatus Omnitrophota bacterium]